MKFNKQEQLRKAYTWLKNFKALNEKSCQKPE